MVVFGTKDGAAATAVVVVHECLVAALVGVAVALAVATAAAVVVAVDAAVAVAAAAASTGVAWVPPTEVVLS